MIDGATIELVRQQDSYMPDGCVRIGGFTLASVHGGPPMLHGQDHKVWAASPIVEVDFRQPRYATQGYLYRDRVLSAVLQTFDDADQDEFDQYPLFGFVAGKLWAMNGHHRTAAAHIRQEKNILAHVVEPVSLGWCTPEEAEAWDKHFFAHLHPDTYLPWRLEADMPTKHPLRVGYEAPGGPSKAISGRSRQIPWAGYSKPLERPYGPQWDLGVADATRMASALVPTPDPTQAAQDHDHRDGEGHDPEPRRANQGAANQQDYDHVDADQVVGHSCDPLPGQGGHRSTPSAGALADKQVRLLSGSFPDTWRLNDEGEGSRSPSKPLERRRAVQPWTAHHRPAAWPLEPS
jgi:hypothetical protein